MLVAALVVKPHTGSMGLLEREEPLAALASAATDAHNGEARVVLVSGEAGGGKSALLEEFAASRPDARWYWGACDGLFTPRPLGAFADIAQQLGGEPARLFRSSTPRDVLFGALLAALGAPGGLRVLVIEDIHWADEATLDLLRFLARRVKGLPVLIVASYREDELAASYPLRVTLGELATHRWTQRVELAPLSVSAVRAMAADSGLDAAELHRVTGGNPFFLGEVLRTGLGRVPPSARDAVLARADRIGPQARQVLSVASLIGAVVEPAVLERAANTTPDLVDELVRSGLLTADAKALRFRHEIARRAVESAIPAHRRPAIHADILAALLGTGSDDHARLAFHAEAGHDDAAALHHATLAGRRAAELGSHREAAAQFERALRFAADEPQAALAARYDELGDELRLIDSFEAGMDAYQRALSLWREAGDKLREGDTLRRGSVALWRLCRGREAIDAAQAAIEVLEPLGPSVELASAYANAVGDNLSEGRAADAARLNRRARELAERFAAHDILSRTANHEGMLAWYADGDWEPLIRQALDIALAHGAVTEAAFAYTNLHDLCHSDRRYTECGPHYAAGVAYCEEHDMGTYLCCLQGTQSLCLERLGQWDEAVTLAETVLRRILSSPINRMLPEGALGRILARRGDPGASEHLDIALASADNSGIPEYVVPMRLGQAEACWLRGDLTAARREAELACMAAADTSRWLRGETAVWLHRTGSARTQDGPVAEPYQLELNGDWRNAAKIWEDLGCPYDMALALLGSADEAALRQALDICTDLGAVATARVVRRTMRAQGIRSIPVGRRAASRQHPFGLTRREQEVLDLVSAGKTDAEIAAALVLSTKTVGHHVSAILAKLGVPTRRAAAEAARELSSPPAT